MAGKGGAEALVEDTTTPTPQTRGVRKTAASKSTASKTSRSTASKSTASKSAASKSTASKSAASKSTASKSAAGTSAASKSAENKAPARKSTARATTDSKTAGSKTAAERASKKVSASSLPVLEAEDPWTAAELAEVRSELEVERDRLQTEVDEAEADLAQLMRESGEGSGDDQADAGAATWEREHELSLANNAKELLEQIKHALERIGEGTYGVCESCGEPIGKMRLQAFPRATLCLACKQKQERR